MAVCHTYQVDLQDLESKGGAREAAKKMPEMAKHMVDAAGSANASFDLESAANDVTET